MIKKLLSLVLVCIMVFSFASCGLVNTGDPDSGNSGDPGNSGNSGSGSGKGTYPRVTYYDRKDGYKYAAYLQNSHLIYDYGEDRGDGNGVVSYPFEFLNCEDYHYHRRYTLVGYDEARKGDLDEADDHIAILYENGKYVLYDFYRKLIVDDFPFAEVYEDKTFLPENLGSKTFPILTQTADFEKDTRTGGSTEFFFERSEISVDSSICSNAKGYELKTRVVAHGKTDHESQYTCFKFYYDPDTEIGLYCEFYLTNDPKVKMDEGAGEAYYVYSSELSRRVEVTSYEIGKVSPSDVKAKAAEIMKGHESEYKHVIYSEYADIFA